ncbi:MAG: Uma2 family endonuclease [Cyanosarcina radialis HA8281-LM2]|jgi:Uma2 family endonuclease|nr:Uma2 family endonuclease [Cyanosarcina radialis HA8281-LM2]
MTTNIYPPTLNADSNRLKRWTVEEYHRLSELGIIDRHQRTELIAGQIFLMAAKGTPHVVALQILADTLRDRLGNEVLIRTQDPIQLDNFSEPEPDLAIVRGTILDYTAHHPYPQDVYLVVEVADATLKDDCEIKDKRYAEAGITEYWVVDLKNRQLHVFRQPTPTGYATHLILAEPNEFSPLAFPNLTLNLTAILPPVN